MPPIGDLTILVPVDVPEPESPTLRVLDFLQPYEVILLGYFPVPDQAEPARLKDEFESVAVARLSEIADGKDNLQEVLVFTHDRETTIVRVTDPDSKVDEPPRKEHRLPGLLPRQGTRY